MVAVLLLLVAMAGIVPIFMSGLSQASSVRFKSMATNVARQRMEEIRQLDYREITSGTLAARFTGTVSPDLSRRAVFNVTCTVSESTVGGGTLKKVTVDVGWAAPPAVSPVSLTTMIHQQFLGPRGSDLEIGPSSHDPLGSPFRVISGTSTVHYHVAQADWALVYNNLNLPAMAPRSVYMRLAFFDDQGISIAVGDSANKMKIGTSHLRYSTGTDGKVDDVWFEYSFASTLIPDGYWESRATIFNEYDQPGNTWRLRLRVETGAPALPTSFTATPQADNQTVVLAWTPGAERDRAYYVLERAKWVAGSWSDWTTLAATLDPKATTYTDQGNVAAQTDPWGSLTLQNAYRYNLWAVDSCEPGLAGSAATADALIPPGVTTTTTISTTTSSTTTTSSSTTTTIAATHFSVEIKNSTNKTWTIQVKNSSDATAYNGSVGKNATITVSNLPAGNYQITAGTNGRSDLTQSFSLPAQAGQIVMTIL
jgi:hypothetical protein